MLTYLHGLSLMLEPADLVNSSDVRLAVSRIVTWTTEPKSVEVRKVFTHLLTLLKGKGKGKGLDTCYSSTYMS